MQRTNFAIVAGSALLVAIVGVAPGCGSGNPGEDEGAGVECQVDEDCPEGQTCNLLEEVCQPEDSAPDGGSDEGCEDDSDCPRAGYKCDLLSNTCVEEEDPDTGMPEDVDETDPDTGLPEDTMPPEDTMSPEDTAPPEDTTPVEDSGMEEDIAVDSGDEPEDTSEPTDTLEDSGVDSGTDTSEMTDTGTDTTDSGGQTDTGTPTFSNCSTDADCSGYLVCDTTNGRCEDPRSSCSSPSDCGTGETCIFSKCVSSCGSSTCSRNGLSCETVTFSDGSSADFCLDSCDSFSTSFGSNTCGEDTQCMPFFGNEDGVCRGVGSNNVGETCETDYSEDSCAEGSFCVNNRGDKTCKSLCSSFGSPDCSSGEFCNEAFIYDQQYDEASDPAGFCLKDCGGYGNTNDTLCSSSTQSCQPESADHGYCTPEGTVSTGGDCGEFGAPYCQTGDICLSTDSSVQNGICRSHCDPSELATLNACDSDEACIGTESDFGYCVTACDFDTDCPAGRGDCAGVASSAYHTEPSSGEPDVCFPSN
jgi:hypothetical protein